MRSVGVENGRCVIRVRTSACISCFGYEALTGDLVQKSTPKRLHLTRRKQLRVCEIDNHHTYGGRSFVRRPSSTAFNTPPDQYVT